MSTRLFMQFDAIKLSDLKFDVVTSPIAINRNDISSKYIQVPTNRKVISVMGFATGMGNVFAYRLELGSDNKFRMDVRNISDTYISSTTLEVYYCYI